MKKKQLIAGLVLVLLIAVLLVWGAKHFQFDFAQLGSQVAQANWWMIAAGIGCILCAYIFRSVRWAWLMRHNQRVGWYSLIGSQVIGFTAVALIGRVADPVRPFLVSKRTGSPLATQLAVYVVERLFDFGAMALIISSVILSSPAGALPHPEAMHKTGFGGLAATVAAGVFLFLVRLFGKAIATLFEKSFGLISPKLGHAAGNKIRSFHSGLDTMRSFSDFLITLSLSLAMWMLISAAYLVTLRAFVACPELAGLTLSKGVVMMAISGTASSVTLPVIGWFSQIAIVAASLTGIFQVGKEAATAAAAVLLLVTFLCIIPVGLIWAQIENIDLRSVARESGAAGKELESDSE